MSDDYEVSLYKDNLYQIVRKRDQKDMYIGTIEEVNAWLEMVAKGFEA